MEDNNPTTIQLEKPTEEEILATDPDSMCDDYVDMTSELDDLEDGEETPEERIDLSTIELDDRGVPIVNQEDILMMKSKLNLQAMHLGAAILTPENLFTMVVHWYSAIDEYHKLVDSDPQSITDLDEKSYDMAIQALASIQQQTRQKEDIIPISRFYESANQNIIYTIFCTMLWRDFIDNKSNESNLFDKSLSLQENLQTENYASIYSRLINYEVKNKNDDNILTLFNSKNIDALCKSYKTVFKKLFLYIAGIQKHGASVRCERIMNQLTEILYQKVYNAISVSAVHNKELQEIYLNKAYLHKDLSNTEKDKEARIEALKVQLESNSGYLELLNYKDKDEMFAKLDGITGKIFDLMLKLSGDFPNKQDFLTHLIKIVENLEEKEKKLLANTSFKNIDELAQDIIAQIKAVDLPEEKKEQTLIDVTKDLEDLTEEEIEEIYKENIDIQSQSVRDKITPVLYPKLFKIKLYRKLITAISYYLSEPNDYSKTYNMIIAFLSVYLQNISLDSINKRIVKLMYDNTFTNVSLLDDENYITPINDLLALAGTEKDISKGYNGNSINIKYKTYLTGRLLSDIAHQSMFTEFSDTSDDYIENIYKLYNTSDAVAKDYRMKVVTEMLERNLVEVLRYNILKDDTDTIAKVLDKFDIIFEENIDFNKITEVKPVELPKYIYK